MTVYGMTGFGTGQAESEGLRYEVRLRSVNHRYLDVSVRVPSELDGQQEALRSIVRSGVKRGRVEMSLAREYRSGSANPVVILDEQRLEALYNSLSEFALRLGTTSPSLIEVMSLGQFVRIEESELPAGLELKIASEALRSAVEELRTSREVEGAKLAGVLSDGLVTMVRELETLKELCAGEAGERMERVARRVRDLLGRELDPLRLHAEAAVLAERSDIKEELDRLDLHFEAFTDLLDSGGLLGKRLDFLCQEILRELNTAGSKLAGGASRHKVVDMKTLLEQIREQVQNLE